MRTMAQYFFFLRQTVPLAVLGGLPLLRSIASVCGTCHTDPTGGGVANGQTELPAQLQPG